MKTIIVPTDFSPAALNAARYAADMALTINADILLLHVYQLTVPYSEIPVGYDPADLHKSAETEISLLNKQLTENKNGKVLVTSEVRMGAFFPELKAVCENVNPYAVIMGSQGTTAAERLFFGGHTIHTMKHLAWPVIAVPAQSKFTNVKKIGLACDLHHVTETIPVDEIKLLINDFNARLHVLNIGKETVYDPEIIFQSGMLQELLGTVKPEYHLISHGDTDKGILDFAQENHIDLLIVLPKRHSLMDKIIHKSHTSKMVLHSMVPVMALHA